MTDIVIFISDNLFLIKIIFNDKAVPLHFVNERFKILNEFIRTFDYGFEYIGISFTNPETGFSQSVKNYNVVLIIYIIIV